MLDIRLKSANGLFHPGQTVDAVLVLRLTAPTPVKVLRINVVGHAKTGLS